MPGEDEEEEEDEEEDETESLREAAAAAESGSELLPRLNIGTRAIFRLCRVDFLSILAPLFLCRASFFALLLLLLSPLSFSLIFSPPATTLRSPPMKGSYLTTVICISILLKKISNKVSRRTPSSVAASFCRRDSANLLRVANLLRLYIYV